MSDSKEIDRRKYPRFNIRVPLNLSIPEADTENTLNATSVNVSMNGVYCTISHYIPVFERVLVMFVIPQESERPYNLVSQCEGIVVRIEPENEEPEQTDYKVALYFQDLSQAERIMLRALISTYS